MRYKPLEDKRIVITRAGEQQEAFAEKICALGGIPLVMPTIAIKPLEDSTALDEALRQWRAFDWVVFTSANGVRFAAERCSVLGVNVRVWNTLQVAAIGSATANALEQLGVRVDFVPSQFLTQATGRELPLETGAHVLLLRADIASGELANLLAGRGVMVADVAAYRTVRPPSSMVDLGDADAITFTSPSTVQNLWTLLEGNRAELDRLTVFCIGPVTADAARVLGLNITAVAAEHTIEGLTHTMCAYYERNVDHVVSRIAASHAF